MTKYEEILKELETTTTMEGLRFAASGVAVCEDMGKITHEEAIPSARRSAARCARWSSTSAAGLP